jgi:hypothetical protein
VILATDELSSLTPAFAQVWRDAGAHWVVRSATGGLREGFTGRRLDDIGQVLAQERVHSVDDVAVDFLRPRPSDALEIMVTVSLRHRARRSTVLGGPAEALARLTGGRPPTWGAFEPVGSEWDRDALTAFARERMPDGSLLIATGPDFAATISASRTSEGIEEITRAHLNAGTPTTIGFEAQRASVVDLLANLASTAMPLVAIAMARPAGGTLLTPPVLQLPPVPLALLIGPPGVKSLGLSPQKMVDDFGALIVGRPRIPGLLFPLGTIGEPTWQRLDDILTAIGKDTLRDTLGSAGTVLADTISSAQGPTTATAGSMVTPTVDAAREATDGE